MKTEVAFEKGAKVTVKDDKYFEGDEGEVMSDAYETHSTVPVRLYHSGEVIRFRLFNLEAVRDS